MFLWKIINSSFSGGDNIMPLNAGKSGAFIGLVLASALGVSAQTATQTTTTAPQTTASPVANPSTANTPNTVLPPTAQLPSAADIMRARVAKAKAYVAIKNYAAAIYELEGIKRESKDSTVNSVTQVMLMNCYLEQMDYKRAQAFLTEIFNQQKANMPGTNYFAAAGQVVKSARNQLERYKSLGLTVSDRNLPIESVTDLDKMRETLEMVVTQSKTLGADKKLTANSMALLEEASGARSNLGRDEYDSKRWKDTMADARDDLMNSRTAIINAVEDPTPNINNNNAVASTSPVLTAATPSTTSQNIPVQKDNPPTAQVPFVAQSENVSNNSLVKKTVISSPTTPPPTAPVRDKRVETTPKPAETTANIVKPDENKPEAKTATETVKDTAPLQIGSLVEYATEKANPTYPPAARMMRKTGTVRVEVVVDEEGKVAEVKNASGESLLQRAATDALKKWRFKPFTRNGQPAKATGYISFNFNL